VSWKMTLILLLVLVVTVFIFQNHEITKVKFLSWSFEGSEAVVLFLTLLVGMAIGGIISFVVHREYMKTPE